jgi:hypothetical protein
MRRLFFVALALVLGALAERLLPAAEIAGPAQQVLAQAARDQKYTFLLFYRDDNAATRAMAQALRSGAAKRGDRIAVSLVSVANPAEQAVIKKFGVSRAPLPFALAVAPNGAITGLYSQKLVDANLDEALVTPGMAHCMKCMQDQKLVLVCVHTSPGASVPQGVHDFQTDPEFKDRVQVMSVQANDPSEAAFLKQMEIVPAKATGSTVVFLAPPAVLVGKFSAKATKEELAAALHKAGKCCDDPNCKHAHGPHAAKGTGAKRN